MQVEGGTSDAYGSMTQAVNQVVQEEGIGGLFSGFGPNWLASAAERGVYYYWYQRLRDYFGVQEQSPNLWRNFLVSMAAAAITVFFINPFWVVNTRQATNKSPITGTSKLVEPEASQGFFPTLKRTVVDEGILSLYSGLFPALGLAINPAIQYTSFELFKHFLATYLLKQKGKTPTSYKLSRYPFDLWHLFLLGVASKTAATILTYPLMIIRSRMQVSKQSFMEVMRQIYKEDGLTGFFRGLDARILFSVLNAGLLMMLQDRIADFLSRLLHNLILHRNTLKQKH
jgi:adenine nucleotide transporter 17